MYPKRLDISVLQQAETLSIAPPGLQASLPAAQSACKNRLYNLQKKIAFSRSHKTQ